MKKTVYLYWAKERNCDPFRLAKHLPLVPDRRYSQFENEVESGDSECEIGLHRCPYSPPCDGGIANMLSDIWQQWGYHPDIVVGHSTGELAALTKPDFISGRRSPAGV
jgi:acyl transferase domain-containing protein